MSYPRETVEDVKFGPVTVNGAPSTDFTYAITAFDQRPPAHDDEDGWLTPLDVDADKAFLLTGMEPGTYKAWVKVDAGSRHIVIAAGQFSVD